MNVKNYICETLVIVIREDGTPNCQ